MRKFVRRKSGQATGRKPKTGTTDETEHRVRLPRPGEIMGLVEALHGGMRMTVRCADGKIRMGRIPGAKRRRMWVRVDDYVLIEPWPVEGDKKCNIVHRYWQTEVEQLRRRGLLQGL
ncbi:MAG: translation initiation factor eIF-1A [DPANN group archaeon]|nr:translation initiation factor eIF-1A [DPANN group archaeon]